MEIEPFGIEIVIPANAFTSSETQLEIAIITDASKYLPLKKDEVETAFGIQILPDGVQFNTAVTVTIPHCISSSRLDQAIPIVYSGTGKIGKNNRRANTFSLIFNTEMYTINCTYNYFNLTSPHT